MAAHLKGILRKILEELGKKDFKRFKRTLGDEKKDQITWSRLEKANIDKTLDLIVQVYPDDAGTVMLTILRKMEHNQSANNLEKLLRECSSVGVQMDVTAQSALSGEASMAQEGADGDARRDLTVVILGKTGSGKSAVANTILGKSVFEAKNSFDPVTQHCKKKRGKVGGRTVTVIDTPGLSCHLNEKLFTDIKKCVKTGPHVFLLVIRVNETLTDEVKNAIKWVEENVGKDVLCYIIVLFTYVDQLQETPLENYCRASQYIRSLINSCGGRFHPFISDGKQDNNQVKELLEKIDKLVWWNSDQTYTIELDK